jgi:MtN3 and saliva related transmembrane protein
VSPVRLFRRNRGAAAAPKNHPSRVTELLGWLSSAILVATIAKQVYKQWKEGSSEGVSRWLFVGQIAASAGFTVYSGLVGNPVFVVTNAMLLASAVTGLVIVLRHRRRSRRAGTSPSVPRPVRTA